MRQHDNLNLDEYQQFIPLFKLYSENVFNYETIFDPEGQVERFGFSQISPTMALIERERVKYEREKAGDKLNEEPMSPRLNAEELKERIKMLPTTAHDLIDSETLKMYFNKGKAGWKFMME